MTDGKRRFYCEEKDFYLDGEKIIIRSGAMHYFRIPKEYWYDRLLKLKECGFNTVETYVAWNLHEREEGTFSFERNLDLGEFLDIAKDLGLLAIVRPGPYICAEWEGGGFPYWLLNYEGIKVRSNNPVYLEKLTSYIKEVLKYVSPRLIERGGNVIMLQIENEYGSFGADKDYLNYVKNLYNDEEKNCVLFTCDGADIGCLKNGSLKGILSCANFGSKVEESMKVLKEFNENQPYMSMEFWCGWFDHWGGEHITRDNDDKAKCIDDFLKNGYSFNVYMFHGGTNFGFLNGANYAETGEILPTVTSYDYDGILTESGDRTASYYKIREIIKNRGFSVPEITAKESEKASYGKVSFTEFAPVFDNLDKIGKVFSSNTPLNMEKCSQAYGYIYYEAKLKKDCEVVFDIHDRAVIFDGENNKTLFIRKDINTPSVSLKNGKIKILVENLGRINFGQKMFDKKGILNLSNLENFGEWTTVSLPMDNLDKLKFNGLKENLTDEPAFFRASFNADEVCDTFLKLDGFSKGFVTLNGFNLGRFWKIGPTKTLFVPKTVLKKGENELIVFDGDGCENFSAEFIEKPILG